MLQQYFFMHSEAIKAFFILFLKKNKLFLKKTCIYQLIVILLLYNKRENIGGYPLTLYI